MAMRVIVGFITSFVLLIGLSSCGSMDTTPLIRDCPEAMIEDKMPTDSKTPNTYYIYKGKRRELSEFDQAWIQKNCDVKKSVVY